MSRFNPRALARTAATPQALPSWMSTVGVVGLVVLVGYFGLSAISSAGAGPSPAPTVVAPNPSGVVPTAAPTNGSSTPSTPAATPAPTGTVEVPSTDGSGMVTVDVAAVQVASAAAIALFTGDFTNVPLVGAMPAVGQKWADPIISEPVSAVDAGSSLRVLFDIDPDGAGSEVSRRIGVTVVNDGGQWAYQGG